jgi:hypothetical protein
VKNGTKGENMRAITMDFVGGRVVFFTDILCVEICAEKL